MNPHINHLKLALHLFGYLKKYPNKRTLIDSRSLEISDPNLQKLSFHPDYLEDCDGIKVNIPTGHFPVAHSIELDNLVFCDADLAHDIATKRSISGFLVLLAVHQYFGKVLGRVHINLYLLLRIHRNTNSCR